MCDMGNVIYKSEVECKILDRIAEIEQSSRKLSKELKLSVALCDYPGVISGIQSIYAKTQIIDELNYIKSLIEMIPNVEGCQNDL